MSCPAHTPLPRHSWRGTQRKGSEMPEEQKGPGGSNYLHEFVVAILAVFVSRTDSVVADIILVALTGYLVIMDYRDRRRR